MAVMRRLTVGLALLLLVVMATTSSDKAAPGGGLAKQFEAMKKVGADGVEVRQAHAENFRNCVNNWTIRLGERCNPDSGDLALQALEAQYGTPGDLNQIILRATTQELRPYFSVLCGDGGFCVTNGNTGVSECKCMADTCPSVPRDATRTCESEHGLYKDPSGASTSTGPSSSGTAVTQTTTPAPTPTPASAPAKIPAHLLYYGCILILALQLVLLTMDS